MRAGAGSFVTMYWNDPGFPPLWPSGLTTVTSTGPTKPSGVVTTTISGSTRCTVAGRDANSTCAPSWKPLPYTASTVPPW